MMDRIKILIEERHKIIVCIFFAAFLCIGISIFKDYGISADERASRANGIVALKYVVRGDKYLFRHADRDYGPAFEILLVAIESVLNLTKDPRAVYLMRHLVTFLVFYISVYFFYRLCRYRFRDWKMGLLGSTFLILSPRIFAHSFYNSKDIACLSLFIISIYTLSIYLNKMTLPRAFLHSLACAILIDIRIVGVIVPFFTIVFFAFNTLINGFTKRDIKREIQSLIIYIFFLVFFTILFWPTLWASPIFNFIEAIKNMAHFRANGTMLYLGNYVAFSNPPWHYIPLWIAISTPISYTVFFIIGFFLSMKRIIMNPRQSYLTDRYDSIFLLWFFLPLGGVIAFKSRLYDEWRQIFFIYPAFLMVSLIGLVSLFKYLKLKFQGWSYRIIAITSILLIASNLMGVAQFMLKHHPFQNIYFNRLTGRSMKEIKNNFELDYWGLSYRKALEYIVKNDKDEVIKIYVANYPGVLNADLIPSIDRKRLVYVEDLNEARYFLSNYRWHKEEYPYSDEYYSVKIDGVKIMVVYRL